MKNKKQKKLLILIFIFLIVSIFFFYIGKNLSNNKNKTNITSTLLENKLTTVSELITTDYHYKNMASFQNQNDFYGWDIPFTEKKFIISYEGSIKLGTDLNQASINIKDKDITINIKTTKIISHEIDEDSVKVFDEKTSIFNPIKVEDYSSFSSEQKKKIENSALKKGILEESNKKSIQSIKELFLIDDNLKDYNVKIKIKNKPLKAYFLFIFIFVNWISMRTFFWIV